MDHVTESITSGASLNEQPAKQSEQGEVIEIGKASSESEGEDFEAPLNDEIIDLCSDSYESSDDGLNRQFREIIDLCSDSYESSEEEEEELERPSLKREREEDEVSSSVEEPVPKRPRIIEGNPDSMAYCPQPLTTTVVRISDNGVLRQCLPEFKDDVLRSILGAIQKHGIYNPVVQEYAEQSGPTFSQWARERMRSYPEFNQWLEELNENEIKHIWNLIQEKFNVCIQSKSAFDQWLNELNDDEVIFLMDLFHERDTARSKPAFSEWSKEFNEDDTKFVSDLVHKGDAVEMDVEEKSLDSVEFIEKVPSDIEEDSQNDAMLIDQKVTPAMEWYGLLAQDRRPRLYQTVPDCFPRHVRNQNIRGRLLESFTRVKLISIAWKIGVTSPDGFDQSDCGFLNCTLAQGYKLYVHGWIGTRKAVIIRYVWNHLVDTDRVREE